MSACRAVLPLLVALVAAPTATAQPDRPVKKTHDVSDLLGRPGRSGVSSVEEVVNLIAAGVAPQGWAPKGPNTLAELHGRKIEVVAPAKVQAEVAELLEALRRLHGIGVDVSGELLEVEKAAYEKARAKHFGGKDGAVAIGDDALADLRKKSHTQGENHMTVGVGQEGVLWSRRVPFVYRQGDDLAAGTQGVTFRAAADVTPDRREVKLTFKETGVVLLGIDKGEGGAEKPRLEEKKSTAALKVEDGVAVLVTVAHQPQAVRERGRVLLLVVRPVIYIAEEKQELGNNKP
jgi:hypothetical protein